MALEGWKVDKKINVGHLITTVAIIVSGLWWVNDTNHEIRNLKQEDLRLAAALQRSELRMEKTIDEIKGYLVRIENKLDSR